MNLPDCKLVILVLFVSLKSVLVQAQFPGAAGHEGTTAIHTDSCIFVGWASGCAIERGFLNIQEPELGLATFGDENAALGKAEGNSVNVVSLGDGGIATLTFPMEIVDREGWDFAVFENSLNDTFLELAFVEVSSDGVRFFRFPSTSLTDTGVQVATFGEVNCTSINNLAGKYRQGYGTPFDLAALSGNPGLDIQHITHVKIVDVVGCVDDDFATFDAQGNKINDPWPTPFNSGGFDLDAVGVIHSSGAGIENRALIAEIFPNPCNDFITISTDCQDQSLFELSDLTGNLIFRLEIANGQRIGISDLFPGFYIGKISGNGKVIAVKLLKTDF